MDRTLQPEDSISHYKIVGPLGAGGMGEVYLAHDTTLERDVALKILPPELVKNEDRVRRFILEAKSASSLSHPHIVTIYEIGRDVVKPAGGDESAISSEPVHFIAMELITGETLQDKIHREKTDLKSLLRSLAQAAEGLAKAHAAGIIHRDLKPGNIMVTKDGYAKVLDFGLAKLTDLQEAGPDATSAPTEVGDLTGGGVIVGTFGYMSPEQIKGRAVDSRSDIFSFGCLLYEAATRSKPFAGDTSVDTMHKILHDQPTPVDVLNPEVPSDVRRLIRRCLAKNPDQRFQSIKDVAIDLREIVDDYEALSASATSGSGVAPAPAAASLSRRPGLMAGIVAAVIIGVAGIAIGVYGWMGSREPGPAEPGSFQSMRMNSLMSSDEIQQAVVSADARYVAYSKGAGGSWSLWVRQVATGSDVEILPDQREQIRGISFSPDGNYLYYLGRDPETPNYSALFEVPSLGGASTKKAFDVDSAVEFSPDGRRIAFARGLFDNGTALVLLDLESGSERVLATIPQPDSIPFNRPSWSPDGRMIAAVVHSQTEGFRAQVTVFDVEDGSARPIGPDDWPIIDSLAWLPEGDGLVLSALDFSGSLTNQVMSLGYPDGRVRRITNDLNQYNELSLAADGEVLAVMRDSQVPNIWAVPPQPGRQPSQMTFTSGSEEGIGGVRAFDDSVLFTATKDREYHVWEMPVDSSSRRQITSGSLIVTRFWLHRESGRIVFTAVGDDLVAHIWRVDRDGGNQRQLTSGSGEWMQDLSPDGRTLLFVRWDTPNVLWSLPVEGGDAMRITADCQGIAQFSPDGLYVSCNTLVPRGDRMIQARVVLPAGGGEPVASLMTPPRVTGITWAPDSQALTHLTPFQGEGQELVRRPIDGTAPSVVLRLGPERAGGYRWSEDGEKIIYVTRSGKAANLWQRAVGGGEPERLTDFRTGRIFEFNEDPGSGAIYFTHGLASRDVILIRDFR